MPQKKTIYYIAFPIFVFLLCMFTYNIGFNRGISHAKKEQISKVLDELEKTEGETSKLTYYQDLHSDKNPIVEQVHTDQAKKPAPTVAPSPTLTVTKEKETSSSNEMSVQVGAFTDLGKADELTDRLKNAGFEAYTKPIQSKGNELFRVLVRSTKPEVANVQSQLSEQGYKNTFVVTR